MASDNIKLVGVLSGGDELIGVISDSEFPLFGALSENKDPPP